MSACFNQFNGFIVLIMLSTLTHSITKVFINYNSYNAKWEFFFKERFFLITEYLNIRYLIMFFLYIIVHDKKNYKKNK